MLSMLINKIWKGTNVTGTTATLPKFNGTDRHRLALTCTDRWNIFIDLKLRKGFVISTAPLKEQRKNWCTKLLSVASEAERTTKSPTQSSLSRHKVSSSVHKV